MGWWKIDPETGKALDQTYSALSRPPELMLLNAVPGVDNEAGAHYLGDAPWDFAHEFVADLKKVLGDWPEISGEDADRFIAGGPLPKSLGVKAPAAKNLKARVKEFWGEIDELYRDEWNRKATDPEKRWIRSYAVRELSGPPSMLRLDAKTKRGAEVVLTLLNQHDIVNVSLFKPRSRESGSIEVPAKVLAAAIDEPKFRLFGQARTARGPAERVMESSVEGDRRRLKITGPMGKGPEAFVPADAFRRSSRLICGLR